MTVPTQVQVGHALAALGNYRVRRAQAVALEGTPDGISGSTVLALGLRETWGRNIEGGAKLVNGRWVPEDDPLRKDVGVFQISRRYHLAELKTFPGVRAGTWSPPVPGKTAADGGYVPRFEESLQYTVRELRNAVDYAKSKGVPQRERAQFAVAAHNCGLGGALDGWRKGNLDRNTAGGDYSKWVFSARTEVNRWLASHPNWRVG